MCFTLYKGRGSVKLTRCNSLCICHFTKVKGVKKMRKQGIYKIGEKWLFRFFYKRVPYKHNSPEGRRSFKCQPFKCHLLWFYKNI